MTSDDDWAAVILSLRKARKQWAWMLHILEYEGVNLWVYGLFYKAVVQAIWLYGLDKCILMPWMVCTLRAFHHRVACQLTGGQPERGADRGWF